VRGRLEGGGIGIRFIPGKESRDGNDAHAGLASSYQCRG
jgi:hypothetical protein